MHGELSAGVAAAHGCLCLQSELVCTGSSMNVVVVRSLMIRGLAGVQSNMYGSGFCVAISRVVLFVLFYILMFSTLLIAVFAKLQVNAQHPFHSWDTDTCALCVSPLTLSTRKTSGMTGHGSKS